MAALAITVVWLLTQPDTPAVRITNAVIWAVFVVDYITGLAASDDRRRYLRTHVPELIATLPFDLLRVTRLARLARLVRLVRSIAVLYRISRNVRGVLTTNGLGYVLVFTAILVFAGGSIVQQHEAGIGGLGDGVWWAIVTTTTVGYGDIAPVSGLGRAVAASLMLVGIGVLGMVTGAIATYFLGDRRPHLDPDVEHIRQRLAEWPELDPLQRRHVARMLSVLAESPEDNPVHNAS